MVSAESVSRFNTFASLIYMIYPLFKQNMMLHNDNDRSGLLRATED